MALQQFLQVRSYSSITHNYYDLSCKLKISLYWDQDNHYSLLLHLLHHHHNIELDHSYQLMVGYCSMNHHTQLHNFVGMNNLHCCMNFGYNCTNHFGCLIRNSHITDSVHWNHHSISWYLSWSDYNLCYCCNHSCYLSAGSNTRAHRSRRQQPRDQFVEDFTNET